MKCNTRELALLSDHPCEIEGRLNYKKISTGYRTQAVFKERWFRLIKNYLFYFKISEMGKFDTKNPAGVFVMENSSIQMEHGQSIPFSFSISFIDEPEKKHVFAARAEENVTQWVLKLRECSYEYLRNRLHTLQSKIYSITGKDPLLLVPRNEGACLWAPSVPFSTTPACTTNTFSSSFSCHLHTNGVFTLERSKSDLHTCHFQTKSTSSNNTKFYTETLISNGKEISKNDDSKIGLERSITTAQVSGNGKAISVNSIFDSSCAYTRAAPSPPMRTRHAPPIPSSATPFPNDLLSFTEQSKHLGVTSILETNPIPKPPRRKLSPRSLDSYANSMNSDKQNTEDLIKL